MRIAKALVIVAVFGLGGCATTPPSSVGLYGDTAGAQAVKGSSAQTVINRTVPYTAEEVRDAAEAALFRKGLNVEEKNASKGRVTAAGAYRSMCGAGPCNIIVTVAVYSKQISSKPSTRMTLLVDRHTFTGWGGGDSVIANEIVGEIQKILTTYK